MKRKVAADAIKITKYNLTYELIPVDEGGYVVTVVDYPSCSSQGETIDEAIAQVEDALLGCLEVDREAGLPISETLEVWLDRAKTMDEEITHSSPHQTYQGA